MDLSCLNDEFFTIQHLTQNDNLDDFYVGQQGYGLEKYLKEDAKEDEKIGLSRTYLIRRKDNGKIAAYFSLRTGLITVSRGFLQGFDTYTGIELANFAVDDFNRIEDERIPKMGAYIFAKFVFPLVSEIHDYVGAAFLYIFALPEQKLIDHYKKIGFKQMDDIKAERYVYRHVKPYYDKGCKFMIMTID